MVVAIYYTLIASVDWAPRATPYPTLLVNECSARNFVVCPSYSISWESIDSMPYIFPEYLRVLRILFDITRDTFPTLDEFDWQKDSVQWKAAVNLFTTVFLY
jgi:hypothetical protein